MGVEPPQAAERKSGCLHDRDRIFFQCFSCTVNPFQSNFMFVLISRTLTGTHYERIMYSLGNNARLQAVFKFSFYIP